MSIQQSNRPHSMPPTNVQGDNDYEGVDRGLFLSRDVVPKYLRVVAAEWKSHGPNTSPGILRFKLGQYENKPVSNSDFDNYTPLESSSGNEWFDIVTSGPIHSPILAEYWAKYIYYNYYGVKDQAEITSVFNDSPLMTDVRGTGIAFTHAIMPSIHDISVLATYGVSTGKPLTMLSMTAEVVPVAGNKKTVDIKSLLTNYKGFDPVIAASKLM